MNDRDEFLRTDTNPRGIFDNTDLELRWPPDLLAAEAAVLGRAVDAGTYEWRERLNLLLEEAFATSAVRDYLAGADSAALARDPWNEPKTHDRTARRVVDFIASQAMDFPVASRRRGYWSKRNAAPERRIDSEGLGDLFLNIVQGLDSGGYFGQAFPSGCEDKGDDPSNDIDPSAVLLAQIGIPKLWPLRQSRDRWEPSRNPDAFYDIVEALHDLAARPRSREFHSYFEHWHYEQFSPSAGQALYRWRVNDALSLASVDLRLSDAGEDRGRLVRVGTDDLEQLTKRALDADSDHDARVHAVAVFRSRGADREAKRSAVTALARLLEDRRKLIQEEVLSKDEGALFEIANQFDIRHKNSSQRSDYDEVFLDWIYWWYLATLELTDKLQDRPPF